MPKHTEKKNGVSLIYLYAHSFFAKMLNPSELYHYKHISESIEPEGLTPVINTSCTVWTQMAFSSNSTSNLCI